MRAKKLSDSYEVKGGMVTAHAYQRREVAKVRLADKAVSSLPSAEVRTL